MFFQSGNVASIFARAVVAGIAAELVAVSIDPGLARVEFDREF